MSPIHNDASPLVVDTVVSATAVTRTIIQEITATQATVTTGRKQEIVTFVPRTNTHNLKERYQH